MKFSLCLVIAVAGCGRWGFAESADATVDSVPVVPPPTSYVDGSRLRAEIHEIGTTKQFVTWFDTKLGEPCQLYVAEDGVTRCLPNALEAGSQFTESTCTTPSLIITNIIPNDTTDCPQARNYALVQVGDRRRVVQPGATYTGTLYQGGPGNCTGVGANGFTYVMQGATVSPDTFVAFHDVLTPSGDLAYIEHVGDDGSRQLEINEMAVRTTGEHCELVEVSHDERLCLPKATFGGVVYADATCTERAIFTNPGDPVTPRLRSITAGTACGSDHVFDVSYSDEITTFYQLDAGVCTAHTLPGYHIFRVTSIDPAVPLDTGVLEPPASGPVGIASWRFTQGQTLPGALYNTEHGDFCYVIDIADTYERVCAPYWTGYLPVYTESTCTTPANGFPRCQGAWRAAWFPTAPFQYSCEGTTWRVYAYDQPVAGPFFDKSDTTCAPLDPTVAAPKSQNPSLMPTSQMTPVTRRMD